MANIGFANLPSDWPTYCDRELSKETARASLRDLLLKRWKERRAKLASGFLTPRFLDKMGFPWSMVLGFAIAQEDLSDAARQNLIGAFEDALHEFEPGLEKGQVWLTDLLALRYLRYSPHDADLAQRAMELMLEGLEKVPAKTPKRDFRFYQRFYQIYSAITEALVTEPLEPETIRESFRAGARLLPETYQSLFQHMARFAEEADQQAELAVIGLRGNRRSAARSSELRNWSKLALRCESITNSLFATLCGINRDFSDQMDGRKEGDDYPTFAADSVYSLARELDVPWFRLAHASTLEPLRQLAIHYIRQIRTGEEALHTIAETRLSEVGPIHADTLKVKFTEANEGRIGIELLGEAERLVNEQPPVEVAL